MLPSGISLRSQPILKFFSTPARKDNPQKNILLGFFWMVPRGGHAFGSGRLFMKHNHRQVTNRRHWFLFICVGFAVLLSATTFFRGRAANPTSGSLGPGGPVAPWDGKWDGVALATGSTGGEDQCIDSDPGRNCDQFQLMVTGTPSDWIGKLIQVKVAWTNPAHDYDLYIHKGSVTDPEAASGTNSGQPNTDETAYLDPAHMGVGLYTVHVAYAVVTPGQDIYKGSATVVPGMNPALAGTGLAPRFQNHYPQPSLIAAAKGADAGEPSIGVNWKTGKTLYLSGLTTFRVTFDDSCPAGAQWSALPGPGHAV